MKTIVDFDKYFNSSLQADLKPIEETRKSILGKVVVLTICLCAALLLLFAVMSQTIANGDVSGIFIFAGLACFAIYGVIYYNITKDYVREFKSKIIQKIVKFVDENLVYEQSKYVTEGEFESSRIFEISCDRYKGDDLISGKLDKTAIKFSEIHAEYKTTTVDSKGRTHTQWHTIFKGLFFIIDFNKNFSGRTVVLPDIAENLFGFLGKALQSMNMKRDQLIKLEDPEFEKEFAVYGTDQIEARYILSSSLMKRIVEFKRKAKRQVYLSFVQSKMYIAISYTENLFEPRVFRTLLEFGPYREYFNQLELAAGVVDDLNLNTRIWSKT